jgi:hypothetical protein
MILDFILKLFGKQDDCSLIQTELKAIKTEFDNILKEYSILEKENDKLKTDIISLSNKITLLGKPVIDFDYSFIKGKEISEIKLVTEKFSYFNTNIPQHLTDLLDSSYTSRKIAKEVITNYKLKPTDSVDYITLQTVNHLIKKIKYVTNEIQYGHLDQWDNGDLALISNKGDCDVSARATIRVLKDVLSFLDKDFDVKNIFLFIGMVKTPTQTYGHGWVQIWLNGKWVLCEMTLDTIYKTLKEPTQEYIPYFCHNNRKGFYFQDGWEMFL